MQAGAVEGAAEGGGGVQPAGKGGRFVGEDEVRGQGASGACTELRVGMEGSGGWKDGKSVEVGVLIPVSAAGSGAETGLEGGRCGGGAVAQEEADPKKRESEAARGRHPGEGSYTVDGGFSEGFLRRSVTVWETIPRRTSTLAPAESSTVGGRGGGGGEGGCEGRCRRGRGRGREQRMSFICD